jgi:SAM-dependent MidA family methyltransferase
VLRELDVRSVSWFDQFEAPAGQPLIVVANEFFDALPIHQYVATKEGWRERRVGLDADNQLTFVRGPVPLPKASFPLATELCGEGVVFEFAPARNSLAARIGYEIAANGGAALIIDYGFSGPALGDTLQAMKAHAYVPVLDEPGHADVTSHVDFTALATGFAAKGADIYGPLEQGAFIERLGGRERTAVLAARATPAQREALERGLARLTATEQMGSLFKVLAIASRGVLPPGFSPHERH